MGGEPQPCSARPALREPTTAEVPDVFVNETMSNAVVPEVDAIELRNPERG